MKYKNLIQKLGFTPKENTSGIFQKKYSKSNGYAIEIDFEKEIINFGDKVKGESKTTQNFSQAENWVVLECVNRLLDKGYQPQNITLEKTWKTGHGTSGRLDVLVSRDDNSAYLMIECKNWGAEFDKEFKNLEKNGGQLFTYFQQDKNAEILMLYASDLDGSEIKYRNEIIKIEEDYRQAGNVKDFYERWNKLPKSNGVFDNWASVYEFQSKALTKNDLKVLKQEDSSFIFNRFLEILRHNVVSDKPNAFNKIFTLFLCKIVDENRNPEEQLHFQWFEGEDNHISFQKRLTDLYNRGMLELLEKKVTDVSDSEFDKQFQQVEDQYKEKFKEILTEIRLKKNNEFAIKEVYDDASFEENAKVVKEVVELLQVYQIRYNYRQQFLSDFFELLLTTGLKQESGQFFTPVPIARFIIKSLPFQEITEQKIEQGNKNDLLPTIIDYAAGSGHFITESMEVVQNYIDELDENKFNPTTKRAIKKWKEDQFDWAESYVYGIEKDYRLVKTAKVSCYLHGDGLAKVIHGDGLGDFASSIEFKDLLKETDRTYPQDNKQFDIIISNPPYSVSAFKGSMVTEEKAKKAFDLYSRLTDQSSEIECLFIERTKQLLKDGGVAGIILPSSILNNTGIYTQTREIILKYFDILGVAELGSGTFMATGTNTVTLFLRRRNNADAFNIEEAIKKFLSNLQDVTINGIEKPIQKYISHVWNDITFEDYISLLKKEPNTVIKKHEIFQEYDKKIKAKNDQEKWNNIFALEQDKLLYFIIAYPQKIVLVKTGEKNEEKRFLGYEFSNRRGSEGIRAMRSGKTIDDCTQLYDVDSFDNPEKASTYIYRAFKGEFDLDLPDNLKNNLSYHNLVDMLTFDRIVFEKNISLSVKKKVEFKSKWETTNIGEILFEQPKSKIQVGTAKDTSSGIYNFFTSGESVLKYDAFLVDNENIYLSTGGNAVVKFFDGKAAYSTDTYVVKSSDEKVLKTKFIFYFLENIISVINDFYFKGVGLKHLQKPDFKNIKIPLPPEDIQDIIVSEIMILEKNEEKIKNNIEVLNKSIADIVEKINGNPTKLQEITKKIGSGATPKGGEGVYKSEGITFIRSQNVYDGAFFKKGLVFIDEVQAKKLDNVAVEKNDILFNITGASIARCCIVDDKYLPARVNQHVSIIRVNDKAMPKYVQQLLVSETYKNRLLEIGDGATSREAITKTQLEDFKIPLASPLEQQKIVLEIEKIEAKKSELEKQIALIPKQKEQILKKYLE